LEPGERCFRPERASPGTDDCSPRPCATAAIILSVSPFPLIGVCGPIGAGKSTIAAGLADELGYPCWPERVADNPFFERYTHDQARWAFLSQLAFMVGAVQDATAARREQPGGVLERPAEEMFGVFVRHLHQRALIADDEFAKLERVLELGDTLAERAEVLILLDAHPQLLLERVRERARAGEGMYDLVGLQRIAAAYATWRRTLTGRAVIDVNVEAHDLRTPAVIKRLADEVRSVLPPAPESQGALGSAAERS
jgi:deoxyadenosine/deoxycytidine kinase